MLMRILAICGAALLIAALAIATLASPDLSLGQAAFELDAPLLNATQAGVQRHLAPWVWSDAVVPLLLRPAWLIPAALGIILCGVAVTLASRRKVPTARRWRG
jgi:hypothetical protein